MAWLLQEVSSRALEALRAKPKLLVLAREEGGFAAGDGWWPQTSEIAGSDTGRGPVRYLTAAQLAHLAEALAATNDPRADYCRAAAARGSALLLFPS